MTMEAGPSRSTSTVAGVAGRRLAGMEVAGYRVIEAAYANGQSLPRHTHPRPALSFVSRGSFREMNRTGTDVCSAGMMHVRPSEHPHSNRFEGVGTRVLIVDIPLEPALGDRRMRRLIGRPTVVSDGGVRSIAGKLRWELHHRDIASDLAVEGLVIALLAQLVRATTSNGSLLGDGTHSAPHLERAREFIDAHFARALPLTELASVAGLHPSSLARAVAALRAPGAEARALAALRAPAARRRGRAARAARPARRRRRAGPAERARARRRSAASRSTPRSARRSRRSASSTGRRTSPASAKRESNSR